MVETSFHETEYEASENILHVWHSHPVVLGDSETIQRFFASLKERISRCPEKPYMLVNAANVEVSVDVADAYKEQVATLKTLVRGVWRYGLRDDVQGKLTGVAVRLGTKQEANLFPDEATAREALAAAKKNEVVG